MVGRSTSDVAYDACVVCIAGETLVIIFAGYVKVLLPTQKATPRGVLLPIIFTTVTLAVVTDYYAMPLIFGNVNKCAQLRLCLV